MKFAIAVFSPAHAPSSRRALRFAEAALAGGHEIARLFFYQDGVHSASANVVAPQDEQDIASQWRAFIEINALDAVVCIAAALRRGVLDEAEFERCCTRPVRRMVDRVRARHPHASIIGFPKDAGAKYQGYREATGVDALGLDWTVPLPFARELQKEGTVQGLLDPMRLIAGGRALDEGVDRILDALEDGPHIFNLGHGITPQCPIEHVEQLVERVRRR